MREPRDDIFNSQLRVNLIIQRGIDDAPDPGRSAEPDWARSQPTHWRARMDPEAKSYLSGFRDGLLHAQALLLGAGGASAAAIWESEGGEEG